MRIATSLISIEQAKHNLELELARQRHVRDRQGARAGAWDEKLGTIEVEGATEDQRTTLYSNLYRLFLYPNSALREHGHGAAQPRWQHAVQSSTSTAASTPTQTGAPVVDGKVYVNNGFWDTYRTTWSAYSLFTPKTAGELVDGFVQQYRDGGWIARWSSPGYANLMTGTSSDVAFADAYVKGVQGFDATRRLRRGAQERHRRAAGRPVRLQRRPQGPVPVAVPRLHAVARVGEGVSWALEGDINDYGIANMAGKLAGASVRSRPKKRRYAEEREYFRSRAQDYVNMFDPAVGFFQGRDADGRWKSAPEDYDPRVWGHEHDYTETDGWNFAFHAPQDGQGLANLYGGRDGLANKLDAFFSTPETATFPGSYGGTIHEMIEARDVRMGQWGFSNQVSHHIPYMYDYAGQPSKTAEKVREALRRLYVGSEIGQGYAGDEDNGETSAWYLFSALGFYPLQVGSENYVIGSPLFKKATVHLENGKDLVVNAPNNSAKNVYVHGLKLNGKPYRPRVPAPLRDRQRRHARRSTWARSRRSGRPASDARRRRSPRATEVAAAAARPDGRRGRRPRGRDAAALFDDDSSTTAAPGAVGASTASPTPRAIRFYTLTSGTEAGGDPSAWAVKGSNDGTRWTVLDERSGETFRWRSQTRPFKLRETGSYAYYRIEFSGRRATLGEVELLQRQPPDTSPLVTEVDPAVASAGETVTLPVKLTNHGASPASGTLTATAPDGLDASPRRARASVRSPRARRRPSS